jgi:hypothetical protein
MSYGITLNAIISILAVFSRSMLIFAVSMCIGQLKWCWYHERKRKVEDIQTMVRIKLLRTAKRQLQDWLPRSPQDMQLTHVTVIRITARERERSFT